MRVGIIGGGQLAMMLCQAAKKLNVNTVVLDPNKNCSASFECDQLIVSDYDNLNNLEVLAATVDVVTYEFENISVEGIDHINKLYGNVIQGSVPLRLSNDRLTEKQAASSCGFLPAAYCEIKSCSDIEQFASKVGYPLVLKTRRFGYDGKGQLIINNKQDISNKQCQEIVGCSAIAETMVDLEIELSVIALRNPQGEIKFVPSTINEHRNNILYKTTIEADVLTDEIKQLVTNYLEYHKLIGIITVEIFISKAGEILFNEIAPRPHNSGHWSIEGSSHSQFDMHLRSICNMEMVDSVLLDKTVMINILGQDYEFAKQFASNNYKNVYFHDYLKDEAKLNRKMGHFTAVGTEAINKLNEYQLSLKENNEY